MIRTYRVSNIKEAIARIKADLGDRATIVRAKMVRTGLLRKKLEVVVTIPDSAVGLSSIIPKPPPAPAPAPPSRRLPPPAEANREPPPPGMSDAPDGAAGMPHDLPPPELSRPVNLAEIQMLISPLQRDIRKLYKEVKSLSAETVKSGQLTSELRDMKKILQALNDIEGSQSSSSEASDVTAKPSSASSPVPTESFMSDTTTSGPMPDLSGAFHGARPDRLRDTAEAFRPTFMPDPLQGTPMGAQHNQAGYCPVYQNLAAQEEQASEASPPSSGAYRTPAWLVDHVYQPS